MSHPFSAVEHDVGTNPWAVQPASASLPFGLCTAVVEALGQHQPTFPLVLFLAMRAYICGLCRPQPSSPLVLF